MTEAPKSGPDGATDEFSLLAEEFAKLLVASDLDDETQEAILNALPHMPLEEIVDLVGLLEAKYVVGETTALDTTLKNTLSQISATFIDNEANIDKKTIAELEALANTLE